MIIDFKLIIKIIADHKILNYNKNMKRNKRVLVLIVFSFLAASIYAKSKKTVEKYVHPRNYTIDLADSETKAVMSFDGETLSAELVFSEILKDDMPRAGDRIKIIFNCYSGKTLGELSGQLYDRIANSNKKGDYSYKPVTEGEPELLVDTVIKNQRSKGLGYFILTDDVDNALCLKLYAFYAKNPKKLNKTGLVFHRITKSVNTTQELEALKEAEKKGWEIVEVESNFTTYEDEEDYDDIDYEADETEEVDEISDDSDVDEITDED